MDLASATANQFTWPNPPHAGMAASTTLDASTGCEVIGLNTRRAVGRLTRFAPEDESIQVQLLQTRRSVSVRFEQFRSLRLTTP
ncbi:MAG: hypothetical protein ABW110_09295, partial [Steroidobacteraceae bacterium]